jgi:hypothetical protein
MGMILTGEIEMSIKKMTLAATMAMCFLPIGPGILAEEGEAPPMYADYQVDQVTCREMLMMGGASRDFTMAFMHGFMSGKKSELLFQVTPLTEATAKVMETCIDNPDDMLLAVFKKVHK